MFMNRIAISRKIMSYQAYKIVKKFTYISMASVIILISGTSYANKYIESAEKYIKSNEINSAIIELKNAIKTSPKDSQPRIMLGEIYLARGNFPSAEKELSRAMNFGANPNTVLPLLVRSIAGQGRNEDVITLIDNSPITDSYAQTELLSLKALSQMNLNDISGAKFTLELAKDSTLETLYSQLGQARLDAENDNIDSALASINKILEQTKTNSDVWLLKGHLETTSQRYDDAVDSYLKAYELAPDAFQYTIFIARALVYAKRFDEAEHYVDKILSEVPNHVLTNELKAAIEYSRKKYTEAKEYAERAIHNGSTKTATILISGVSSYQLNLYEQAYERFSQIIDKLPNNHYATRLYIATQLHLGYINEAIDAMNKLNIESVQDSQFLSKASLQLSKLGRDEEALQLIQKASDKSGNNNQLMLGLVKLAGDDQSGFKNIKAAIANQPNSRNIQLGLAHYYLKFREFDEAEAIAEKWLKQDPNDIDALVVKGLVNQSKEQFDNAEAVFRNIIKTAPDNFQAHLSLSQIMVKRQNWNKAYSLAVKAKTLSPNSNSANQVLLISAKQLNNFPALLQLLNQQIASSPSNTILKHHKARALALSKKSNEAINLLENISDIDKGPETWELIGDIYYTQKNWLDAERAYSKWLEISPANVKAHIRNIHIREQTKKLRAAIQLASNAEQLFPSDIRFPMMKAGLLLKSGDLASSQRVLDGLNPYAKETPYALKIQGLLYVARSEFNAAVKVNQLRYKKQPGVLTASELASVYELNGQAQKAISFLTEIIKTQPKARALEIKLADIQTRNNPQDAIKQYKIIIDREPKNFVAANNLAWLYMNNNQSNEAYKYAKKAYDMAGNSPLIADTYGYSLLKIGQLKNSVKILKIAHEGKKSDPEIALHYAESLIENNKFKEAKRILSNVTTEKEKLVAFKSMLGNKLEKESL